MFYLLNVKVTMLRRIRVLPPVALILLLALLAACGSDAPSVSPTSGAAAPATEGESESAPPPGSVAMDREVLVAFYNAMDGDNWTNNANWLSEAPLGEWHGVHTNSNGRVFNVRLTDNQLSGELPSELGSLTYLIILGIEDNQVSGEIPVELGNLPYLASLEFLGNQLSGEIPPELGSLPKLLSLRLEDNQLSGQIPPELGNLSSLEDLDISGNQLAGEIPSELGRLSNLEVLHLNGNQLTGEIPPELGSLSNLEYLQLNGNQLTGCTPGGLEGVEYSDADMIGLPFCGETGTYAADSPAQEPTKEWESTVNFSVFHDTERDLSPKVHVVEIPIEKCWTVSFVLAPPKRWR